MSPLLQTEFTLEEAGKPGLTLSPVHNDQQTQVQDNSPTKEQLEKQIQERDDDSQNQCVLQHEFIPSLNLDLHTNKTEQGVEDLKQRTELTDEVGVEGLVLEEGPEVPAYKLEDLARKKIHSRKFRE